MYSRAVDALTPEFWPLVAVGFVAQLIDGALGMAYGISASAALATLGYPPALVSATVHAAEVVTTGVSGVTHAWFRNIDRRVFVRLVIPGMIGGAIGAWLVGRIDAAALRPFIWGYLLIAGVLVLRRAFVRVEPALARVPSHALGGIAGFLDAVGGGGWGPLTTPTLIAGGTLPRYAVGTVNVAEFFVSLTISLTFVFTFDWQRFDLVLALLLGGVVAAPFAAWAVRHVAPRPAMMMVGSAVIALSLIGLWRLVY